METPAAKEKGFVHAYMVRADTVEQLIDKVYRIEQFDQMLSEILHAWAMRTEGKAQAMRWLEDGTGPGFTRERVEDGYLANSEYGPALRAKFGLPPVEYQA